MNQLCTASRKIMIKYVGPVVIYKIIDPHNYLLMTLDGKILRGLFEHETETSKFKNKSRKCLTSCAIKTSYECRIQDLGNLKLINSR